MNTPCVCYMRCSGRDQISGDTWERQLASIRKYAAGNALEIVEEFRDEGVTGKMELENRNGLSACIHAVQEQKIGIVLVESSDRLARDSIVAEICIREFQKIGVRVVSAEGVDLTAGTDLNPTAKLIRQILAAIAEFDRCVTVNKLRGARQRKKQQTGRCEGVKPFGELPGEVVTSSYIQQMSKLRYKPETIAHVLNSESYPSRSGKPWSASTIRKILARQVQS